MSLKILYYFSIVILAWQAAVAGATLEARWNFEGNYNDLSGNGYNGIQVGTVPFVAGISGGMAAQRLESNSM